MSEPVISVGNPTKQSIPPGDDWTTLATGLLRPADGRTQVHGQLAVSLSDTIANRPTLCELQVVRLTPGQPENPTGGHDQQFTFEFDSAGKIRIRKRQNWQYNVTMRTYSDEPLRIEARHPGKFAIALEWIFKLDLLRAEGSR